MFCRVKYLTVIFIIAVSLKSNSFIDDRRYTEFKWQIGEELTYRIKWLFLNIGSMKFQILEKDSLEGHLIYHCRLYLDSNPSLPFIDLHEVYDSYIDEEHFSHGLDILVKKSDCDYRVSHNIDYTQGKARILVNKCTPTDTILTMDSTIVISEKIQDGVSILYFCRALANQEKAVEVSVLSYKEIKPAQLEFTGVTYNIKVKDKNLQAYYLDGLLKFAGIGGIKEGFKGWFSTDAQRVPLKAQMKAFLGSVKIELISWKYWIPYEEINAQ